MDHKEIDELREIMGTMPAKGVRREDKIIPGCQEIYVTMLDCPTDPYRAIYEGVAATWGNNQYWGDKWDRMSTEGKLRVLLACLGRKTLPEALEAPKFTFAIRGASRAAFDQFARHRIGVGIGSKGTRDNEWTDASLRLPWEVYQDEELRNAHIDAFGAIKDAYEMVINNGKGSWQSGRFILPMGVCHNWVMSANYLALQNMAWQREKFCEQFDTVGVMWLIWNEIHRTFPLLACFLRPGCDWTKSCQYHNTYNLSELFGCLFASCRRHSVPGGELYHEFNTTCSSMREIERDLQFTHGSEVFIPKEDQWDDLLVKALVAEGFYEEPGQVDLEKLMGGLQ